MRREEQQKEEVSKSKVYSFLTHFTPGFLTFSGSIERGKWCEIGKFN